MDAVRQCAAPATPQALGNGELGFGPVADRRDDEDLADMVRELRGYDPKPGCRFGSSRVDAVTPDVFVVRTVKGWAIDINSNSLPRVLVDRRYHAELATSAKDKASKHWLAENLASATWLVKALDQRQRTIVRVASVARSRAVT